MVPNGKWYVLPVPKQHAVTQLQASTKIFYRINETQLPIGT